MTRKNEVRGGGEPGRGAVPLPCQKLYGFLGPSERSAPLRHAFAAAPDCRLRLPVLSAASSSSASGSRRATKAFRFLNCILSRSCFCI